MISLKKDELRHFVLFQANLAKLMIISVLNAAMRRFKTGNFFFFFISSFYIPMRNAFLSNIFLWYSLSSFFPTQSSIS